MRSSRAYYTLIGSLPQLPAWYDAGPLPISTQQLRDRLELLQPRDRQVVRWLTEFFLWDRQPLDRSDSEVWETYALLQAQISNPLARQITQHRTEMRTLLAALRAKRADEQPLSGPGPLLEHIRRHWRRPYFDLDRRYSWIAPFDKAMDRGAVRDAQKILFDSLWKTWTELAAGRFFTFEAVLLYLARWEIVERWTSQNADEGRRRFANLLRESLGDDGRNFAT